MEPTTTDRSLILDGALAVVETGVIVVDYARRVVLWNAWIEQRAQIPAQAAVGRTIDELFAKTNISRLAQAISEAIELRNSGFLSHALHPSLLPLRRLDGRPLAHNIRVRHVEGGGRSYCMVQIDDITEAIRREAVLRDRQNARYRAVVDSALDAIVTTDAEGVIQWMNDAAVRHFGYSAEEAVGRAIGLFLPHPGDWPLDGTQEGAQGSVIETDGRRKDGSVIHLDVAASHWTGGGQLFVTGILRDSTERWVAAETLRRLNEDLERKVEERTGEREEALAKLFASQKMESIGQLTGGLAHDFNNLLAAILSNLDILRKRLPNDPKIRRLLDGAIHGAERGASVTARLLAFARRQELKPETVDVGEMVSGMTELLERSLGAAIQVKVDIPSGLPAMHVDLNQLELAMLNLAVNARDAMPFGGSLSISAAPVTFREAVSVPDLSPGDYIRISVTDTGVGMDDTILAQAREPFFTTKGPGKGTGLGLSMVQGLAVQSGGALRLRSKPGKGTTVDLWLPKSRDVRSKTPVVTPALAAPQRRLNILLIDDDVLVRMGTLDMLEDLGHVVTEVGSAAEALTILQAGNTKVDVVITDQAMPGMRGSELAADLAKKYPGLPVILATGYAELPNGADPGLPRLSKPFRQDDIMTVLQHVVQPDDKKGVVVALRR
jgi:PAS domain S-box-containing protein